MSRGERLPGAQPPTPSTPLYPWKPHQLRQPLSPSSLPPALTSLLQGLPGRGRRGKLILPSRVPVQPRAAGSHQWHPGLRGAGGPPGPFCCLSPCGGPRSLPGVSQGPKTWGKGPAGSGLLLCWLRDGATLQLGLAPLPASAWGLSVQAAGLFLLDPVTLHPRHCMADLCTTQDPKDQEELRCQVLSGYAILCQEEGTSLASWRDHTGCGEALHPPAVPPLPPLGPHPRLPILVPPSLIPRAS